MGLIGDVLEILHGPVPAFTTLHATIRQRGDDLTERLEVWGVPSVEEPLQGEPAWQQLRLERDYRHQGGGATEVMALDGDRWWRDDPHDGIVEGDGSAVAGELVAVDRLFSPCLVRRIVSSLVLSGPAPTRIADRSCIHIRAVPRRGQQLWPHWLPRTGSHYHLWIDAECGAILRMDAFANERLVEQWEVTTVVFDEPLDEGRFAATPGHRRQTGQAEPAVQPVTLGDAAELAPFTLLIPPWLPPTETGEQGRACLEVMYLPERTRRAQRRAPMVAITLRGLNHDLTLTECATGSVRDETPWQVVEHAGRQWKTSTDGGHQRVRIDHEGTTVLLSSSRPFAELVEVADALVAFDASA